MKRIVKCSFFIIFVVYFSFNFKINKYQISNEIKMAKSSEKTYGQASKSTGTGSCSTLYLDFNYKTGNDGTNSCSPPGRYNLRLSLIKIKDSSLNLDDIPRDALKDDVYELAGNYYVDIFPKIFYPSDLAAYLYGSLSYSDDGNISGLKTRSDSGVYIVDHDPDNIKAGIKRLFGVEYDRNLTKSDYMKFAADNIDSSNIEFYYVYFANSTKAQKIVESDPESLLINYVKNNRPASDERLAFYNNNRQVSTNPTDLFRDKLGSSEVTTINYNGGNNKILVFNEKSMLLNNNNLFNGVGVSNLKDYIEKYNTRGISILTLRKNIMKYIAESINNKQYGTVGSNINGNLVVSNYGIKSGLKDNRENYFSNMTKENVISLVKDHKINGTSIVENLISKNGISYRSFISNDYYVLIENLPMYAFYYYDYDESGGKLYIFSVMASLSDMYNYLYKQRYVGRFSTFNSLHLSNNECETRYAINYLTSPAGGEYEFNNFYCDENSGKGGDLSGCHGTFSFYSQAGNHCFLPLVSKYFTSYINNADTTKASNCETVSSTNLLPFDILGTGSGVTQAKQCIFNVLKKNNTQIPNLYYTGSTYTSKSLYDALKLYSADSKTQAEYANIYTDKLINNAGYGVNILKAELYDFKFREIDTNNPFPGASGNNTRMKGYNWDTNCKVDNYIKNANDSFNKTGSGPMYSITLTPSDIIALRNYHYEYGSDDESEFLEKLKLGNLDGVNLSKSLTYNPISKVVCEDIYNLVDIDSNPDE